MKHLILFSTSLHLSFSIHYARRAAGRSEKGTELCGIATHHTRVCVCLSLDRALVDTPGLHGCATQVQVPPSSQGDTHVHLEPRCQRWRSTAAASQTLLPSRGGWLSLFSGGARREEGQPPALPRLAKSCHKREIRRSCPFRDSRFVSKHKRVCVYGCS